MGTGRSDILITVILLAVCAGAAAYLAAMRQARRLNMFSDEYRKAFEQIAVRISTSGLSPQEKKEASADILDILSLAQNDGRSVKEMLGDNPDAFAEKVVAAYAGNPGPAFTLLTSFQFLAAVLAVVHGAIYLFSGRSEGSIFSVGIGNLTILFLVLVSLVQPVLVRTVRHSTTRTNAGNPLVTPLVLMVAFPAVVGAVYIGVSRLLRTWFPNAAWARMVLDGETNLISSPLALILLALALVGAHVLKRRLRRITTVA